MGHWERHHEKPFSKRRRLKDAAAAGQLLVVRCNHCRRTTHFLASDLVTMPVPTRDALAPPFPCSSCKEEDYVKVTLRSPEAGDYGHLLVRRPAGVVSTQKWRTVKLGD